MMQPKLSNRPEAGTVGKVEETVNLSDEDGKDVEEAEVGLPSPAVHHPPEVAATTCRSQWRRDARVLGSLPLCAMPTLVREYLLDTSGS